MYTINYKSTRTGKNYKVKYDLSNNKQLIIAGPAGDKTIKVINNNKYVIKINNTCLSGANAASGVYAFFERSIKNNILTCYIEKTIERLYK